jgi:hypothetical protein
MRTVKALEDLGCKTIDDWRTFRGSYTTGEILVDVGLYLIALFHSISGTHSIIINVIGSSYSIIDSIANILKKVPRGEKYKILDTSGKDFPLVGRVNEQLEIYNHCTNRMLNREKVDKVNTSLLYVAGFPGTGKSKLNASTESILKQHCEKDDVNGEEFKKYLQSSIFIHVTYNNNIEFQKLELSADPLTRLHALCVRILYFYVHPPCDYGFRNFFVLFDDLRLTMTNIIDYIVEKEGVKYVHIGVDEFNKLMREGYNLCPKEHNKEEFAHILLRDLIIHLKSGMGLCKIKNNSLATPLSATTTNDSVFTEERGM